MAYRITGRTEVTRGQEGPQSYTAGLAAKIAAVVAALDPGDLPRTAAQTAPRTSESHEPSAALGTRVS